MLDLHCAHIAMVANPSEHKIAITSLLQFIIVNLYHTYTGPLMGTPCEGPECEASVNHS